MEYDFTERGVRTSREYRYPKPEYAPSKDRVYDYWARRCISKETIDYLGIQEDTQGNTLFQYWDLNDVLVTVKVRRSAPVKKGENKCWCLPGSDVTHVLYNISKVTPTQPLIITSGEGDCAACIECGFYNAVSINMGDGNTQWIAECWIFSSSSMTSTWSTITTRPAESSPGRCTSRLGEVPSKDRGYPYALHHAGRHEGAGEGPQRAALLSGGRMPSGMPSAPPARRRSPPSSTTPMCPASI